MPQQVGPERPRVLIFLKDELQSGVFSDDVDDVSGRRRASEDGRVYAVRCRRVDFDVDIELYSGKTPPL